MTSKRLLVPRAVLAMIAGALPQATILGIDGDDAYPTRPTPGGRVVVRTGDPGDPEIDLSPLSYNYAHRVGVELLASDEDALDAMLVAIGAAVEADRTLGGLVEWLDPLAPETDDLPSDNTGPALRTADLIITAFYSTPHALS